MLIFALTILALSFAGIVALVSLKSRRLALSNTRSILPASLEHRLEYDFKGVEFFFRRVAYWLKIDRRRFFIVLYVTLHLLLALIEGTQHFLERKLQSVLTRIRGTHGPSSPQGIVSSHLQELSGYKKEEQKEIE